MFKSNIKIFILILMLICPPRVAFCEQSPWEYQTDSDQADASDLALPLMSLFVPGAGQWVRGQAGSGTAYSLTALSGLSYAINASKDFSQDDLKNLEITETNVAVRKYMLGLQTYQAAGGLSLYHTFRSSVWQRQKYGEYQFLGEGESPQDILLAPFKFGYLTRSSSWIPLSIGAIASWYVATHPQKGFQTRFLRKEDPWFAAGFSYNAGTHEEAIFRGWLMPVLHDSGLSKTFANVAQATAFALMHLDSNPLPLPQFLLGLHFGSVTARDTWKISEAIFIHAWWDVFAFLGTYHLAKESQKQDPNQRNQAKFQRGIPILLPPLDIRF